MKKFSTLFMVYCVLSFFLLVYVKEVKTLEIKAKVCTKAHVFEQNCGWDGNKTCIKGFNKILEYPFHCECDIYDAAESRRICTCKFPSTLLIFIDFIT
ncbi:hypothetical protein BRARA_A02951 [Brassica rapa]|uniref:Uncharacterized protein n=5 Tax=Brassica TaxID=3705 RepID=A0ABQ8EP57_BRANA|nr:defensin-like protein 229 isoform X1 [Brassica rapa]XP_022549746.2 defensin-like protein 229 [Brassica napus]KAH0943459.1 hypothetical protein HID58_003096 [Brassica napus]RID80278.1 hypothetical protein BRARA_A02951 [Brassica rapa]CAG7889904.1 unnamed protein product [Brassica rapa]VDC77196.1 unnamed protein product [Brassica rapa]